MDFLINRIDFILPLAAVFYETLLEFIPDFTNQYLSLAN